MTTTSKVSHSVDDGDDGDDGTEDDYLHFINKARQSAGEVKLIYLVFLWQFEA